jgi:hypothetical protein
MAGPLGSFLDMLSGALGIVNDIGNALSFMVTPLKIIGGLYLAINAAKKIALGYDIAMKAANQISANLGLAQIGTNRVKLMLEKESLLTRIAGNIQLLFQLTKEHGILGALAIQLGIQKAKNIEGKKGLLITLKDFLYEKGKAIFQAIQKTGLVALNALRLVGATIAKKDAIFSIAGAAMASLKATVSGIGALLGPFAVPLGIAAAAGVAAAGYNLLKADDLESEGYGKRILLAPPNAFALNNDDTILATTNKPSQSSNTLALAESINSMHNTLKQSINKPSIAYINGEDAFTRRLGSNPYLGTSQNMDTAYQMA